MSAPARRREPPTGALQRLAEELRADEVIAPHVREPSAEPSLGRLVAAGPRAAGAPGEYGLLFEAIREGFLLHYGTPRLLDGADPDLLLLAGDYLYALGLERLAARGDVERGARAGRPDQPLGPAARARRRPRRARRSTCSGWPRRLRSAAAPPTATSAPSGRSATAAPRGRGCSAAAAADGRRAQRHGQPRWPARPTR